MYDMYIVLLEQCKNMRMTNEDDDKYVEQLLDDNEKGKCRAVHCVKDDGLEIEQTSCTHNSLYSF